MFNPLQLLLGQHGAHPMLGEPAPLSTPQNTIAQPFLSIFSSQLQNLHFSALNPAAAPMSEPTAGGPGQVLAAGGDSLPATLPPGAVIEVFSYSRVVIGGAGLEQPLTAFGAEDPRADLASTLSQLGLNSDPELSESPVIPVAAAAPLAETEVAPAAPAPSSDPIDPDQLQDRIGQSVAKLAKADIPNAELAVRHPEYGWIEASVARDGDDVSLSFGIQDAGLRGHLESARAGIEEILEGEGLHLVGFTVDDPSHPADPATTAASTVTPNAFFASAFDNVLADTALRLINARA
ncbi:MAG: flagellar hook-length control protein FliK [Gammaproteobacteria bacterium]|nr:flagellar hook-length control protein FliK [Gammaproteobacteria bacterium]